jgi:hypothetical protein
MSVIDFRGDERERILGGTAVDVYRLRITDTP